MWFGRIVLLLIAVSSFLVGQEIPVSEFVRPSQYERLELSPTGSFLAVTLVLDDSTKQVVVLDRSTLNPLTQVKYDAPFEVGDFFWVNEDRLLIQINRKLGWLDEPVETGDLYAVNANGKKKKLIFGPSASRQTTGSHIKQDLSMMGVARLVHLLPDDPKHIMVTVYPFIGADFETPEVYRLNVYSGRRRLITRTPLKYATALADAKGAVRFAVGYDLAEEIERKVFIRREGKGQWVPFELDPSSHGQLVPLAFAESGRQVYVMAEGSEGTLGVYLYDLAKKSMELVFQDASVDPTNLLAPISGEPVAVYYDPDLPKTHYIKPKHDLAKWQFNLERNFENHRVRINSMTWDRTLLTAFIASDINPGDYYSFDVKTKKLGYLCSTRRWIDPKRMRPMKPIQVTARDGVSLHGYLTLPKGKTRGLVVLPHGGPHTVRDYWGFDSWVQLLANRSYAVLQINFRGSAGYGQRFQDMGYGNWGTVIQEDIIDATRWAIDEGHADSRRVAIVGASFGAYAALMCVVREPELFRCAAGYAGVYDLTLLPKDDRIGSKRFGGAYFEHVLGTDEDDLRQHSPVTHAGKIQCPILLVHGEQDDIAPIEHALRMKKALEKHHISMSWMTKKNEGHGFFKTEHRIEYAQRLLSFLATNLK